MEPGCHTAAGCLIPPPGEPGKRALELRGLIIQLRGLIDSGTVCRYFGAGLDDLEMLAIIEDELKEEADGKGCPTADQG